MKKLSMFQVTLLCVFGALAVAGVLIFSFAVGGGNNNTVGAIRIWGTLNADAFGAVIRQASENDAQLTQVTYVQKDPVTYEAELTDALANGGGPDLFLIRQDYAVKDSGKVLLVPTSALSQSQFESTFLQGADPYWTADGAIAVPIVADPLVLYWNKDMLATAGFPQPPKYWDDFYAMAKAMVRKNDAGTIQKSGVALGEYQNIDSAKDILATLIMQAGGTITTKDTTGHLVPTLVPRSSVNAQASVSALRFFTEFADPSKDYYSWNRSLQNANKAFTAGDLALYIGYASEAPALVRANPNLNFAITGLPQVRNSENTQGYSHVYALATSRAAAKPTSAITAAFLLASAENSSALSTALGIPSARRDVLAKPASGNDDLFNKQAILAHSWMDPDPVKTSDIFRAMIENTTSGSLLANEAIQKADQQIGNLLGL